MISLGIIGEYLARIYEEVKGRPRYLVAESIEPGNDPTQSLSKVQRESQPASTLFPDRS
jgi:hypothetical protein